jgi:hypothetical protein
MAAATKHVSLQIAIGEPGKAGPENPGAATIPIDDLQWVYNHPGILGSKNCSANKL